MLVKRLGWGEGSQEICAVLVKRLGWGEDSQEGLKEGKGK